MPVITTVPMKHYNSRPTRNELKRGVSLELINTNKVLTEPRHP